ncbi:MAG: TonB-dependent receptor domain-containing protein [Candidatus Cryptobacteroides sp.]
MNTIKRLLAAIVLVSSCLFARAQKHSISGYVTDSLSGEPLIGVAVIDNDSSLGTVTGNSGYYSISLEKGRKTLRFVYLGYEEKVFEVALDGDTKLDVRIVESVSTLSGAIVTASAGNSGARSSQMSAIEIPVMQIKTIPAIGGEVDVIKALQLLPGVQSGTEGMAGLYVRGGGADENLLLMDGVPLYNVNHLFGFFSVFNADAMKGVTLYKGNFPARFGGHLSSVVDVRMNDGNDNRVTGSASIGLISSKLNLEGPIVKGRTTFNISARRTYMDLLLKPALYFGNKKLKEDDRNYEKIGGGYNFYDLNAKVTHRFNGGDRLSLSFYSGDDKAKASLDDSACHEITECLPDGSFANTGTQDHYLTKARFKWKWGNMVGSLRWNHEISPRLYLSSALNYTQYRNNLGVSIDDHSCTISGGVEANPDNLAASVAYNSLINDISATADFDWRPDPRHDAKFGAAVTLHNFKPGVVSMFQKTSDSFHPEDNTDIEMEVGDKALSTTEGAIFIEDNWSALPWLKLNIGGRFSAYGVSGKTYLSAEPRLGLRALLSDKLSVKASYSEMSQYIHLLCNSNLSMPSDLWVPVTSRIKPMRSRQSAAGIFFDPGKYEFSVEGYYKSMDNILEYKDGASYLGMATGWEDKVCMGRGWAYGVEFLVQKKIGKTTGWIGYTWAKSMRKFDREGMEINDGKPFPAKYDRRHDLSATVTHAFSKRFDLSATFVLASGNCGTLGFDEFYVEDMAGNGDDLNCYNDLYVSYAPGRNNYRMPMYNRMDIGMNFYRPSRRNRTTRVWNLSVYNVYNRRNPFMLMVGEHYEEYPDGHYETYPVLNKISIFPIIPTVTYTLKF